MYLASYISVKLTIPNSVPSERKQKKAESEANEIIICNLIIFFRSLITVSGVAHSLTVKGQLWCDYLQFELKLLC